MVANEGQRPLYSALGRVPSGIFIVTLRQGTAETGMLASWIQQCSFDPPLVTVAIKRGRFLIDWLNAGAPCTINILDDTQTDMIGHFGRGFEPNQEAFTGVAVRRRPDAAALLEESLAYLDVRVLARHPAGDHELFITEVVAGAVLNEGRPMIHVRKSGSHY